MVAAAPAGLVGRGVRRTPVLPGCERRATAGRPYAIAGAVVAAAAGAFFILVPTVLKCVLGMR
jgi:hypothetical protein